MPPTSPIASLSEAQLVALLADPDQLDVWFQPVIGFDTRSVCGAESLLRAQLDGVPVEPIAVIDAAVAAGRMREIGRHVLARACRAHRAWHDAGHGCVAMMVNVDATELAAPDLVASTEEVLAQFGVPPDRIVLEITETAII